METAQERFNRRRGLSAAQITTPSGFATDAASACTGSPLSAADRAAVDAQVLGFDAQGREIKLADFRQEGYGIFRRLTHPGPVGKSIIEALSSTPGDDLIDEITALGIDYGALSRAALSAGLDPAKSILAEIEYRREHNAAHQSAPFGPKKK